MNEEEPIFGADPDRLMRLMKSGLEPDEAEAEGTTGETAAEHTPTGKPGTRIGRYKLLRMLGEGGMGVVYLAEQQGSIRRRVALKVIKPGMDSKRVLARFEVERQALALLDHPNIAHVYDAGTTEAGRPYFVMEHVKGLAITEHCDHYKLTIEQRLRLFQQVCVAIQHAHQKGIIHRDIKPSNILVSLQDDKATPKIIDFGVAKALAQPLTERTLATEESQLLGTPEYMSPEQADMAVEDIDTRSDIYSLGVLLYVLLTGVLPFDSTTFREGGIEHIRQVIRETDPKTPSTRLSKLGEEAQKVAQSRRTEISSLTKTLHKELEWIPLKAMRKERAERYRSASELADDIENYMKGNPLIAGPPSTVYRLRKLVRRNRALVTGIAAVMAVLIAGTVVSTIFALKAQRQAETSQFIADFLENDVLGSASKARSGEATAIFMLNAASESLEGKFKDKPLIEASIRQTLGWTYWKLGELKEAKHQLERSLQIYRQEQLGEEDAATLGAMIRLGWVYQYQGRYHDAKCLFAKCLQIRQRVSGVELQLGNMNALASANYHLGNYKEAVSLHERILQIVRLHKLGEENVPRLPSWMCNLASGYAAQGRYKEAEQLYLENLEIIRQKWDADSLLRFLYPSTDLARMYIDQGRYDEAKPILIKTLKAMREVLGDEHFDTMYTMYKLAQVYTVHGDNEEAEKLFTEMLEIAPRKLGEDHPNTLTYINGLAVLRRKQKRYEDAESLFTTALEGMRRRLGDDHPYTLQSMHDLAVLYKEQGDYDKAEPLLLEAVKGRRLKLGDTHPHTIKSLNNLIDLYQTWGKPEQAEQWKVKLSGLQSRP